MSVKKRKYSLIFTSKHALPFKKDRPLQFMIIIYLVVFAVLSLRPVDNFEWWYENVESAVLIIVSLAVYRKGRLTNLSYICILILLILHSIGAHYTYPLCPVGEWIKAVSGSVRNNYDRLVGFAFGFLISIPVMEVLYRRLRLRYTEACIIAVTIITAVCAMNSLVEMYTTLLFSSERADIFIGAQGDVWDSQKDIAISLLGAAINMGSCIFMKLRRNNRIHMVRYRNN